MKIAFTLYLLPPSLLPISRAVSVGHHLCSLLPFVSHPFFFPLSSNLCQWSRLKGSVHVRTNPCVSDGFQPQSLLALLYSPSIPPLPLSPPVNSARVCVCKHMSVAARRRILLHYSFIPFLTHSPVLSSALFPRCSNLSPIPPLHCCYAS